MEPVQVLFYSEFRHAARAKQVEIELSEPLTVRQLLFRIVERVPSLQGAIKPVLRKEDPENSLLVLVGGRIVALDSEVYPGEKVQLMPPISGG